MLYHLEAVRQLLYIFSKGVFIEMNIDKLQAEQNIYVSTKIHCEFSISQLHQVAEHIQNSNSRLDQFGSILKGG